jgi:hypothetical protein
VAINTARAPHRLLTIPLADALAEVSRWLEDCEHFRSLGPARLPPEPAFTLAEAWVVVRLAAQDLAGLPGWSYDLNAAPEVGYVQVAYLNGEGAAEVGDAVLPLSTWSKVYAWRMTPAPPPKLAEAAP